MLLKVFHLTLDCLYPPFCAECHRLGRFLCFQCQEKIDFYTLPLNIEIPDCALAQVISACRLSRPIAPLIYLMKYQNVQGIGEFLGNFLYETTPFPVTEAITAVPLSRQRLNERGFNQAAEIARTLSNLSGIPYLSLLQRKKSSSTQASLRDRTQRLTNLHSEFSLLPNIAEKMPKSILIIDDVITTGTTLNECAKVFRTHGCEQVFGLAVAHGK